MVHALSTHLFANHRLTTALLRARGHTVEPVRSIGEVAAILVDDGWLQGAADSRTESKAAGF